MNGLNYQLRQGRISRPLATIELRAPCFRMYGLISLLITFYTAGVERELIQWAVAILIEAETRLTKFEKLCNS